MNWINANGPVADTIAARGLAYPVAVVDHTDCQGMEERYILDAGTMTPAEVEDAFLSDGGGERHRLMVSILRSPSDVLAFDRFGHVAMRGNVGQARRVR